MTRLFIQDDFNGTGPVLGHAPNIWLPRRPPLYSEFNFGDGSPPPIESDEWMVDHDLGFGTLDLNAGRARFTNDHPALDGITNGSMFLQGLHLQRMGYFNLIHRLPEMPEEMLEVSPEEVLAILGPSYVNIGPTKAILTVDNLDLPTAPSLYSPTMSWTANGFCPSLGFGGYNTFIDGSFRIDDEEAFYGGYSGVTDGLFIGNNQMFLQRATFFSGETVYALTFMFQNVFFSQSPTLPSGLAEHSWEGPFTHPSLPLEVSNLIEGLFPGHYFWYSTSIVVTGTNSHNLSTFRVGCEGGVISFQGGFSGYSDIVDTEWSPSGLVFPMGSSKAYARLEVPTGNITSSITPDSVIADFSDLSIPRTPNANFIFDRCYSSYPSLFFRLVRSGQSASVDRVTVETNSETGSSGWHTGHIAAGSGGGTVRGFMGLYISMLLLHMGGMVPK